jgi:transcriptional regulator with XRE-family HTH domain
MRLSAGATDEALLVEMGSRFARARLDRNLTQAQLAELAGISKRTLERLESGSVATQMSGFIRVCRALQVLDRFELLLPESTPSPMEQLRLQGRKRRRAAPKKAKKTPSKWLWGDKE